MEYTLYKTEKEQRKWVNKYIFFIGGVNLIELLQV